MTDQVNHLRLATRQLHTAVERYWRKRLSGEALVRNLRALQDMHQLMMSIIGLSGRGKSRQCMVIDVIEAMLAQHSS